MQPLRERLTTGDRAIIFCRSVADVKALSSALVLQEKVESLQRAVASHSSRPSPHYTFFVIHGDMRAEQKQQVLRDFMAEPVSGRAVCIGTTCVGMGLHIPRIRVAQIVDVPWSACHIAQLGARAGRDQPGGLVRILVPSRWEAKVREAELHAQQQPLSPPVLSIKVEGIRALWHFFHAASHGLCCLAVLVLFLDGIAWDCITHSHKYPCTGCKAAMDAHEVRPLMTSLSRIPLVTSA